MPGVECSISDFTGTYSHLSANNTLNVSWSQLIWAAVTVGRAGWQDILHDGLFSRFEIVYRVAIIAANLFEEPWGALAKTESYRRLDPPEKAAIFYFLGLDLVKLFVGAYLDTPWLMRLDVYGKKFGAKCPSKSRPDLFGLNTYHHWIVAESKGRTNRCKTGDLTKAKEQSNKLSIIGGQPPVLRFGAVTYFKGEHLAFLAIDPPGNGEGMPQLELSLDKSNFLARYYALVRHFIALGLTGTHKRTTASPSRSAEFPR